MDKGSYLVFAQEFAQGSKKLSVSRTEMTIVTSNYEAAHGCKPRPSQDSVWSFLITRRPGEATPFQTSGTYREAARAVKAEAKTIGGASKITVMA